MVKHLLLSYDFTSYLYLSIEFKNKEILRSKMRIIRPPNGLQRSSLESQTTFELATSDFFPILFHSMRESIPKFTYRWVKNYITATI